MMLETEIARVQEVIKNTNSEYAKKDLEKYLVKLQKKLRAEQYAKRNFY